MSSARGTCERAVSVARDQLDAEVARRFLAERGHLKEYRLIPITGHDAEALTDVEARIMSTSARLGEDDADVTALVERLAELKTERAKIKATPAVPKVESGTVSDEWAKAAGNLQRRRELLLGHLAPGGLMIAPRGKVSHRFDPTRVDITWQPILFEEGPVTYSAADEDEDFGRAPAALTR